MKLVKISLVSILIAVLAGCASIAGDNTRAVHVSSKPQGAAILVDNQQYGVTPATVTLPNYIYGGKAVTLKKKGYESQTLAVNTKFQPIALLDLLAWPTFLIDGVTGDLVKIDPAARHLDTNLSRLA